MDYAQLPRPLVVFIRGLPGSGKSYVAAALHQSTGSSAVMLDPDATDYESDAYKAHVEQLSAEGVDPALHAYRFLRAQAWAGIEAHKLIIWNQPFTNREVFQKMVAGLQTYALEHGTQLDIFVVEVTIDEAIARKRVSERKTDGGHGPSEATFARFISDYESFADEGFKTISVDGQSDVRDSVQKIIEGIASLQQ